MIKNNKKQGQAALEFLTTYGWAFLVILVMIGALAYFGVLDPSNFVADRCVMGNPLSCEGQNYVITNDGTAVTTSLQVRNAFNMPLTITNVTYQTAYSDGYVECNNSTLTWVVANPTNNTINRDSRATLNCAMNAAGLQQFAIGTKERVQLIITYHTGDISFAKTINGEIYSTVQG